MAHICWCLILFSVIIIPSQVKVSNVNNITTVFFSIIYNIISIVIVNLKACQRATPIPKRTVADGLEELLGITKEIIERECQTSDSVYCACYKNEIDGCHNKTLADECHVFIDFVYYCGVKKKFFFLNQKLNYLFAVAEPKM